MAFANYVSPGYEFNQSVLLGKLGDKAVQDGICLSLATKYLLRVKDKAGLAHMAYQSFRIAYSGLVTPDIRCAKPTDEFVETAELQKAYSKDFGGGINLEDAATAVIEGSFRTLLLGQGFDYNAGNMHQQVRAALAAAPWVMLAFSCRGGAHAVAVAKSPDERMLLVFDPNYGAAVTSVAGGIIDDFFDSIIGELVSDYTITKGWASACVPAL